MLHAALNLAVLLILAFCVWQGYRKGLILSVCSVVILFVSAYAAGTIAAQYADKATDVVAPVLDWLPDVKIDEAIDEVAKGQGPVSGITDPSVIREIINVAFEKIGITGSFKDILTTMTAAGVKGEVNLRQAIANHFLYGISYLFLCVFAFLVCYILLTLVMHFISAVFKLPVLGLIDKAGGSALGLLNGLLLLCAVGWVCQFVGVFLPSDLFLSGLLRMFMNLKWLNGLLNS